MKLAPCWAELQKETPSRVTAATESLLASSQLKSECRIGQNQASRERERITGGPMVTQTVISVSIVSFAVSLHQADLLTAANAPTDRIAL